LQKNGTRLPGFARRRFDALLTSMPLDRLCALLLRFTWRGSELHAQKKARAAPASVLRALERRMNKGLSASYISLV
jgi:hypothetical protein